MRALLLKIAITFSLTLLVLATAPCEEVSYTGDIQPIFAEHCLSCHGHDAEQRQADLQLDDEHSAKATAIVAGDPDASPLWERITSSDSDIRMPPGDAKQLGPEQIDRIRHWIASGAKYERHWSLSPIGDPSPPDVAGSVSDIDQFVLEKLDAHGLQLSEPASRRHLIRRATFDLTGLPPTWEEVVAFVDDESPQAFERVVDRLLNSAAYGERWGRHWLDIARYADTQGGAAIGFQKFAFSYTYRDYVINAFNADLPYDQFIREQLAADQLELPDNAPQLAALGFLTVGMQFRSPHDTIDDQIDVVSRGLMGLTAACARCHDHKYDAISTKDYYALYATLASSQVPDPLPLIGTPQPSQALNDYHADLDKLQTAHGDMAREQSDVMRARLRMQVSLYLREIAKRLPEVDLSTTDIFSYRTDDLRPPVMERWRKYMASMPDDDPVFGPWVQLMRLKEDEFQPQSEELIARWIRENGDLPTNLHTLSATAPRWNPRLLDCLDRKHPASMNEVADAYGELFIEVQQEWHKAQLDAALEAIPGTEPVPDESPTHLAINSPVNRQLRHHLYAPGTPTAMDDAEASLLLNRPVHDNVAGRKGAIYGLNLNAPGSPARAMAIVERASSRPFFVFKRGNPIDRGERVEARFLTSLGGSDQAPFTPGARRLSLAQAIVDPANPLTRRVIVNWVWQRHFGLGLVRTPDDFGTRGDPPTHPELLDYLAARLLEDDWSLKALHRRIMLTRVYQQASVERPSARLIDADNTLCWRMPRRRLELEAMRDAMLAVSGELQLERGGRPFELLANPTIPRRSVYAFINRDIVAPLLSTFDGANPNACTAKRPDTMVPQQTLFAMNSDFVQDRAQALAASIFQGDPRITDDAQRVRTLYRRAFTREPDDKEISLAIEYVQRNQVPSDAMAAWQRLAHVLLAANEFLFLD